MDKAIVADEIICSSFNEDGSTVLGDESALVTTLWATGDAYISLRAEDNESVALVALDRDAALRLMLDLAAFVQSA